MDIYSPADCYVEESFVTSMNVRKGDKLLQLVCPTLNEMIDGLSMSLLINDIQRSQYTDGRSEANEQMQKETLDQLVEEGKALDHAIDSDTEAFKLGTLSLSDMIAEKGQRIDNQVAYIKQKIVVDHFKREIADAVDKLDIHRKHVNSQMAIIKLIIDSLLIIAPLDGHFDSFALPGMFFQQGEIIGQFYTSLKK